MEWGRRLSRTMTRLGWTSLLLLGVPLLAALALLLLRLLG